MEIIRKSTKLLIIMLSALILVYSFNILPAFAEGNSLAPGTLILTPNGNILIEELQPGDRVIGYNFSTHKKIFNTIRIIQKISSLSYYLINNKTKISGTDFIYINRNSGRSQIVRAYELKYYDKLITPNHSDPTVQELRQIVQTSEMYKIILDNEEGNFYANNFLVYGGDWIPDIFKKDYVDCGIGTPYFHSCNNINSKSIPSLFIVVIILVVGILLFQYLFNLYIDRTTL